MKLTKWFSIDKDGNPQLPGWYEVAYEWEKKNFVPSLYYWSGEAWGNSETTQSRLGFGNEDTEGERWRGLAEKP